MAAERTWWQANWGWVALAVVVFFWWLGAQEDDQDYTPAYNNPTGITYADPGAVDPPVYNGGGDLDCADFGHPVDVSGGDPHGLDADGDGVGCESYN